ncbi:hypothetical protein CTEN210_10993 [Chaetoceros tenuissimus]|uniref:Kinesin light chain n=1 Tax=Chaetoceros tenuissimus TaxID=426638 RepID=A0AAD3CYV4_9STRA|nr:hypothetical protein CTEN210_10993 [Chaetoceros tenuissimus]
MSYIAYNNDQQMISMLISNGEQKQSKGDIHGALSSYNEAYMCLTNLTGSITESQSRLGAVQGDVLSLLSHVLSNIVDLQSRISHSHGYVEKSVQGSVCLQVQNFSCSERTPMHSHSSCCYGSEEPEEETPFGGDDDENTIANALASSKIIYLQNPNEVNAKTLAFLLSRHAQILLHKEKLIDAHNTLNEAICLYRIYANTPTKTLVTLLMNNGNVLRDLARYDDAINVYQEALEMAVVLEGMLSITVAHIFCFIAQAYNRQGKQECVALVLENTVHIRRAIHGNDHEEVAAAQYSLGLVKTELEEYDEALFCFLDALRIQKLRACCHQSRDIISISRALADLYEKRGQKLEAAIEYEKLIRSAFDCASLVTGQVCDEEDEEDDLLEICCFFGVSEVISDISSLQRLYRELGNDEKANQLLDTAGRSSMLVTSSNDEDAFFQKLLGDLYLRCNIVSKAMECYSKALRSDPYLSLDTSDIEKKYKLELIDGSTHAAAA